MRVDREEHLAFIVDFSLKRSEKSAFLFLGASGCPGAPFSFTTANSVEQHHICEANASYRHRRCII